MLLTGRYDGPSEARFFRDGRRVARKTQIVHRQDASTNWPNAFLIEQEPDSFLPVHFHKTSQFQVVAKGSGTLGRHHVGPLSVHYAGRQTSYGPIRPGEAGLWYLTLRPGTETGAYFMPESRDQREPGIARREAFSVHRDRIGDAEAPVVIGNGMEELIAPQADGLAAWLMHVAPGETAAVPGDRGTSNGRFHVVVAGTLLHDAEAFGWLGMVWACGADAIATVRAGRDGLSLLVLQFPAGDTAHDGAGEVATRLIDAERDGRFHG